GRELGRPMGRSCASTLSAPPATTHAASVTVLLPRVGRAVDRQQSRFGGPAILRPLPGIAMHVEQAPGVRRKHSDAQCAGLECSAVTAAAPWKGRIGVGKPAERAQLVRIVAEAV